MVCPVKTDWTRESILACIRDHAAAAGDAPTAPQLRELYGMAFSQVKKHFGTLGAACTQAKVAPSAHCARWTKAQIIAAAHAYHERTGKAPTTRAWRTASLENPSSVTVGAHWNSWSAFIKELGLQPETSTQRIWGEAEVIDALIRWAGEHGAWPRKSDWTARGSYWPPHRVVRDVFGRWSIAIERAQDQCQEEFARPKVGGARKSEQTRYVSDWTKSSIVAAARRWKRQSGEWPTATAWKAADASWPSYRAVQAHFDSWAELLIECGAKKAEPKRARRRKALPHALVLQVFARDNHACVNPYCDGLNPCLTADHIVAVVNGGSDELSNLQTLCGTCNSRKGSDYWDGFLTSEAARTQVLIPACR